jgi:hypothetical protein
VKHIYKLPDVILFPGIRRRVMFKLALLAIAYAWKDLWNEILTEKLGLNFKKFFVWTKPGHPWMLRFFWGLMGRGNPYFLPLGVTSKTYLPSPSRVSYTYNSCSVWGLFLLGVLLCLLGGGLAFLGSFSAFGIILNPGELKEWMWDFGVSIDVLYVCAILGFVTWFFVAISYVGVIVGAIVDGLVELNNRIERPKKTSSPTSSYLDKLRRLKEALSKRLCRTYTRELPYDLE